MSKRARYRKKIRRRNRRRIFTFLLFIFLIVMGVRFFVTRYRLHKDVLDITAIHDDMLHVQTLADTTNRELTVKEKLNDFETMYDAIKESHPAYFSDGKIYDAFFESKSTYKERIGSTQSDKEFLDVLSEALASLQSPGTKIVDAKEYSLYSKLYRNYTPWLRTLESPRVLQRYKKLGYSESATYDSALILDIPVEKKVAYIKVKEFTPDFSEDKLKIHDFLKTLEAIPFLVIDLRGSQGKSSDYWMESIVAPLIDESVVFEGIECIQGTLFDDYIGFMSDPDKSVHVRTDENRNSASQLKDLQKEGLKIDGVDYYKKMSMGIAPTHKVNFYGTIFILQDKETKDAADMFCKFANQTGFAETVGQTTAGGGTFLFPGLLELPQSGLLLQMPIGFAADKHQVPLRKTVPQVALNSDVDNLNKLLEIIELK